MTSCKSWLRSRGSRARAFRPSPVEARTLIRASRQEKYPDFEVSAVVKTDYSVLHGPAWAIINWLLIDGMKRNSHGDIGEELRKSTVSAIETEGSAECFDLVTGEGRGGLGFPGLLPPKCG